MSRLALAAAGALLATTVASAQRGTGDWVTSASDAQRSSWVRTDGKISKDMPKPGWELLWKLKLNNTARQLNSLTSPALIDFYIGYKGFRTLGFVGGSSNTLVGIDVDLAHVEWEKRLAPGAPAGTLQCPGGMTSAVTRPAFTSYPGIPTARGAGRSNPAKSGVGEPLQGAVTLKNVITRPSAPAASSNAPEPPAKPVLAVHALSGDGKFHSLYLSNGEEPHAAVPFLPPNANAHGLIVIDKTAYVATTNSCGGVENGVWALNLDSHQVTHWTSGGTGVAGSVGPAAGPDGTLYVAGGGGELVALEKGTLRPKASYKARQEFTSSPVVFEFKGKNLIAVATNDGRMHLLDAGALDKALSKTPAFSDAEFTAGALASWQDIAGTRWVLAPAAGPAVAGAGFAATNGEVKNGAIVAWKVVEQNGAPAMEPGWVSRDMISPLPPAIVNGVVFAVSSGEFRTNDVTITAAQRAERSSQAILYALDAITGKELWNSGSAITSFVHSGGLAVGGSRVYVSGYDGTQYAFGYAMEH